jgi:hypothetical protein
VDGADGRFNLWPRLCLNHSYNEPKTVHASPPHQELGSTRGFRTCTAPDRLVESTMSAEHADGHRGTRSVHDVHSTDLQVL